MGVRTFAAEWRFFVVVVEEVEVEVEVEEVEEEEEEEEVAVASGGGWEEESSSVGVSPGEVVGGVEVVVMVTGEKLGTNGVIP